MNTTKMLFVLFACALFSCGNKGANNNSVSAEQTKTPVSTTSSTPEFNADSAYHYVATQVAFGPRVPSTKEHKACGDYLIEQLKRFGAEMHIQEMTLTAYNGDRLQCRNIIGSYNKENNKRILLFAHWDTRPYADEDSDTTLRNEPIDGADDGASGVGVLLEIARQIQTKDLSVGIDIIFFDAEDYGPPSWLNNRPPGEWWALGTQFWASKPHTPNYKAEYGILLDMVGAKNATFYKELTSLRYAPHIVEKVWSTARDLGYGKFFINAEGGNIIDDHTFVISGRGIPCIDIINYDINNKSQDFGAYWHTHQDNMDNINRETLKAVGQTVLEVIYKN